MKNILTCSVILIIASTILFSIFGSPSHADKALSEQRSRIEQRVKLFQQRIEAYVQRGGDMSRIQPKMELIGPYADAGNFDKLEETLDAIDALMLSGRTNHACKEIVKDLEYHCPYAEINRHHDILVSQWKMLYSAKIDGSGEMNPVIAAPKDWGIMQSSISPNWQHMLLTMEKKSCSKDWKQSDGKLCSWGFFVLWLASHDKEQNVWVLKNLATQYGHNAEVHGWTNWQSNSHALFNAVVKPEGGSVFGSQQSDNNAQAYQIRLNDAGGVDIDLWGKDKMVRDDCLTGRLFTSHINNADHCVDGARTVFARRCYSETPTDQNSAWWNTKNVDGSGGYCVDGIGKARVPVLRVYSVETDANCQPKIPFEVDKGYIQTPRSDGHFRLMAKEVSEWGDMQPAINRDATMVAFNVVKGHKEIDASDNCNSFYGDGKGAPRVYYCALDKQGTCQHTSMPLSEPEGSRTMQGQAMFVGDDVLMLESTKGHTPKIIKVSSGKRTELFTGIGGYPLK